MAKPDRMPRQAIIDGFKGVIDFYYWKGVAVARRWPRYRARKPHEAEATNQADFAYINRLYSTLPAIVLQGLIEQARGTTQVPKDYLVRAYLKGLFDLMPPEYYATQETQLAILAQLDVALSTRALEAGGNLAALLAELTAKLQTTDLNIEAVSKDLQVDDKTDYLNQGNLSFVRRWGVHATGGGWTDLVNMATKGLVEIIDFATDYKGTQVLLVIDGLTWFILAADGHSADYLKPEALNDCGGQTSLFVESNYDDVNDEYSIFLRYPFQFNSSCRLAYRQESGGNQMIAISIGVRALT